MSMQKDIVEKNQKERRRLLIELKATSRHCDTAFETG